MNNLFLFFIFIFFLSISSYACEVHLPARFLIFNETADIEKTIKKVDCSEAHISELVQILRGVEGKITSEQLEEILSSKGLAIVVSPVLIQIQQFKQLVREQLMIPSGIQLKSSQAINAPDFLSLAPGDRVDIECIGCLFGSGQILNVNIHGFDGSNSSLTVKSDFKKMVRAYKITSFIPSFSEVSKDNLNEVYVESIPHTDLITNLDTLKFYKLNKPVQAGDLLRLSDLNAINLVRSGLSTEVIIENALVRIKTHGISRSNGSLGETVEVFHPQKNKKYQGKVIDINKVLVEL